MTTSSPSDVAPAQPLELKGTTLPVTAVMIGLTDPAHLQLALAGKLGEAPGFFEGELALLDLTRLPEDTAGSVQLDRIVALLRQAGMIPVAARGLAPSMAAAAEALGLAVLTAAPAPRERPPVSAVSRSSAPTTSRSIAPAAPGPAMPDAPGPAADRPLPLAPAFAAAAAAAQAAAQANRGPAARAGGAIAAAAPAATAPATPAAASATPAALAADTPSDTVTALVVERTLRSGQRVYARGRDLVLMAGVSPGAEVIADGSIHCYGRLRGRALAGASGNAAARIFAQDFQAELVSIAGVWRTFEPADPQIRGGEPVRVSLHDDGTSQAIAIEPIAAE